MKKLFTVMFALMALLIVTVCHASAPPPLATTTVITFPVTHPGQYNTELPVVTPVVSCISYVSPGNLPQVIPLFSQYQYTAATVSFAMLGSPLLVASPNIQAVKVDTTEVTICAAEPKSIIAKIQDDHPQVAIIQKE